MRKVLCLWLGALLFAGCDSGEDLAQLSGTVSFKGEPVPAGYISLTPNIDAGTNGKIRVLQIEDGKFDSSKERKPGIPAGSYYVQIAGFDGNPEPLYQQGKQIFNAVKDQITIPDGESTKDWAIPDAAGNNVQISPTGDPVDGFAN